MEPTAVCHIDQISPYIEEIGRSDARVDALAGNQDRYATYLGFLAEGYLSAPGWQAYRAAYDAEAGRQNNRPASPATTPE